MWSLGVILYILLSGLPPFWGDTEDDIFRMVLKARPLSCTYCEHLLFITPARSIMIELHVQAEVDFKTAPWPQISPAAKQIVQWLLTVDVTKRPSAVQVLQVSTACRQCCTPVGWPHSCCHTCSCKVTVDGVICQV